ncbi:stage III sporulation protein AH [Fusibacter bizertensis]
MTEKQTIDINKSRMCTAYISRTNVTDKDFNILLQILFDNSDEFILISREDIIKNANQEIVLNQLSPYLIDIRKQFSWANTELYIEENTIPATVYYYKSTSEALKIIINSTNGLFDWVQPNFPEDLSFRYKGKYIFTSTTHEKEFTFIDNKLNEVFLTNRNKLKNIKVDSIHEFTDIT